MQYVAAKDADWWICLCGNEPAHAGFSPCDSKGEPVAPTPAAWTTDCYVCEACGRIIRQSDLRVVGVRFDNTLSSVEKSAIFVDRTRLLPNPRQANLAEKKQLLELYGAHYEYDEVHLTLEASQSIIDGAYIAVFEPYGYCGYREHRYQGKLMLVVWPGNPAYHEAYIWCDGKPVRVEQSPVIESAMDLL